MVSAEVLGSVFVAVGAGTFTILVKGGHVRREDFPGWIGATLCSVGGLLTVVGAMLEVGNVDGVILLMVLFALGALTAGIVWLIRHRPPTAPEPTQTGYVHAYGSYDATTVKAARAMAQQVRKGARA